MNACYETYYTTHRGINARAFADELMNGCQADRFPKIMGSPQLIIDLSDFYVVFKPNK